MNLKHCMSILEFSIFEFDIFKQNIAMLIKETINFVS